MSRNRKQITKRQTKRRIGALERFTVKSGMDEAYIERKAVERRALEARIPRSAA